MAFARDPRDGLNTGSPGELSSSTSSSPTTSPSPSTEDLSPISQPPPPQRFQSIPNRHTAMSSMTPSSTPLGPTNAARNRPGPPPSLSSARGGMTLPADIQAKIKALTDARRGQAPPNIRPGAPPTPGAQPMNLQSPQSPPRAGGSAGMGGVPAQFANMNLGNAGASRPGGSLNPAPNRGPPGGGMSMAERRGMKMSGGLPGAAPAGGAAPGKKNRPAMSLSQIGGADGGAPPKPEGSMIDKYAEYLDKETGALNFKGKATLTNQGVQFASGKTFSISLDEVDTLDELGKGNYGTVYKVRHSRPRIRRPGLGLAGNKSQQPTSEAELPVTGGGSGIVMAMKEMRLELDDSKFATIIMELDVLHRCTSPYIVDFYGAFFQEGAVYICMEFMDGGSVDKLYGDGVPEGVLRKITLSTVLGLKSLKDEHNIIHRDVKPTNILVNTKGQVKICDFGVSGNLVASMAKTNIGCQSYMAPERISGGGVAQAGANPGGGTYSVQSDIWSLGLTIIECGLGRYPYPPETYDNIFSQLSVSTTIP